MRDIVDGLIAWRAAGVAFARRDGRAHVAVGAPAARVRRWPSTRAARCSAASPAAVSRAPSTPPPQEVIETRKAQQHTYGVSDGDAFEVGLTCGGTIEVMVQPGVALTEPRRGARRDPRRPAGRHRLGGERPTGHLAVDRVAGCLGDAGLDAGGEQAAGHARRRRHRHGPPRSARRAAEREVAVFVQSYAPPPRMIVFGAIDFAAAMARIGTLPRLPRHGLRRPPGLRHPRALPGGRRARRRVAAPLPGVAPDGRRAHRALRADPRPEVRRAAARGRAAHPGPLHRRDGQPPHPRRPDAPPARGRRDRGRVVPAALADRPGPGRPDAGGDGRGDRRRDHRAGRGAARAGR